MPDVLNAKMLEFLKDRDANSYPFSKKGFGRMPAHKNYWTYRHQKALDACGIVGPTLYSWKHTGVCAAHLQGISVIQTKNQCRHSSLDIHYSYLKKLGVIVTKQMNRMKEI
jgi:integrase